MAAVGATSLGSHDHSHDGAARGRYGKWRDASPEVPLCRPCQSTHDPASPLPFDLMDLMGQMLGIHRLVQLIFVEHHPVSL